MNSCEKFFFNKDTHKGILDLINIEKNKDQYNR